MYPFRFKKLKQNSSFSLFKCRRKCNLYNNFGIMSAQVLRLSLALTLLFLVSSLTHLHVNEDHDLPQQN